MYLDKVFVRIVGIVLVISLLVGGSVCIAGTTPPTEKELLDQSHGLVVIGDQEIIYPDEEGMWQYKSSGQPSNFQVA